MDITINRTLLGQNIIIVTRNMNISSYSQFWFVDNNILGKDDFNHSSSFTPGLIKIETDDCLFQLQPQGIQFILKIDDQSKSYECIRKRLISTIEAMGGIPIVAVGVNFLWRVDEGLNNLKSLGEYLFGQADSPIYDYFNKPDSRLGAYFSQMFDENTRLKLDIKPAHDTNNQSNEFLIASFNYHRQLKNSDNYKSVVEHLKQWSSMRQNSKKVICFLK